MSGSTAAQQAPSLNVTQDLSAITPSGTGWTTPGGQAGPLGFALDTLGPQETYDQFGNPTGSNAPYINPAFGTGLNLSTLGGLDTLAERVSYNDPNAEYIASTGGPSGAVSDWLVGGAATPNFTPDPSNPMYTPGPDNTLDLSSAGYQSAAATEAGQQGTMPGPSPMLLGGLFATAITGGLGALELGGALGAADAAGLGAGDFSEAGLAAGTAAGDPAVDAIAAGGAAAAGSGGVAADLGDTLGLLPGDVQTGIQGADAAGAIAGGANPATALASVPAVDLSSLTASAAPAAAPVSTPTTLASDPLSGNDITLGASTADTTSPATAAATVPVTTPDTGAAVPSSLIGSDGQPILPPPDPGTPPPALLSDLASGNTGALGSDITQDAAAVGNKLTADLSDPLKDLGLGASAIGLGYNLTKSNTANPIPGMSNISSTANQLTTQGQQLESYLTSGTLPPGVSAALNQATQAAIQQVKSKFAQQGVPPNSSMEQQEIANIQQNAAAQGGTLALNLLQQGVSESNLGAQLYSGLVNTNQALNTQTEQSIANLVSALAGSGKNTITIQQAQTG